MSSLNQMRVTGQGSELSRLARGMGMAGWLFGKERTQVSMAPQNSKARRAGYSLRHEVSRKPLDPLGHIEHVHNSPHTAITRSPGAECKSLDRWLSLYD